MMETIEITTELRNKLEAVGVLWELDGYDEIISFLILNRI